MEDKLNSLNNFDFLAQSFARMHKEGRVVDLPAITGNMDEDQRTGFVNALHFIAMRLSKNKKWHWKAKWIRLKGVMVIAMKCNH